MFCQKCGKEIQPENAKFCLKCGTSTSKSTVKLIDGQFETLITSLFRTILIASIVIGIFGVALGNSLTDTLPPLLQEYLAQVDKQEFSNQKSSNEEPLVSTIPKFTETAWERECVTLPIN